MVDTTLPNRGLVDERFLADLPRRRRTPAWVRTEPLTCVGAWEPLFHRRRVGGSFVNDEEWYAYEHSEAFVRELRQMGARVLITAFAKNYHIDEAEFALKLELREHCRRHGVRLFTYIRPDQVYAEVLGDLIGSTDVLGAQADGRVPTYGPQEWRKSVCFHKPGVLDLFKATIRRAVVDLGVDGLHLDGSQVGGAETYEACRCPACRRDFTEFLQRRYGDEPELCRRRFGHTHLDAIEPPGLIHLPRLPPGRVLDPVWQEWIVFRCTWTARVARAVAEFVDGLNPEVAIFANSAVPVRENGPLLMGLDLPSLGEAVDAFMNEDAYGPQILADGKVLHRARQHSLARDCGCWLWNYMSHPGAAETHLEMAHAAAFNQGRVTNLGHSPGCYDDFRRNFETKRHFVTWLETHWAHFQGLEPVADVVVWRERKAMAFAEPLTYATAMRVEQLLTEARIPFASAHGAWPPSARVVVLPGLACLDDERCRQVVGFVESGGGVLVVGETSAMDGWGRRRQDFGLRPILPDSVTLPRLTFAQHVAASDRPIGSGQAMLEKAGAEYWQCGRGRVVYLPSLVAPGSQPSLINPDGTFNFALDTTNWCVPADAEKLLRALAWLGGNRCTVSIDAVRGVLATAYLKPATNAYYVHLVNLRPEPVPNVVIRLEPESGRQVANVTVLSPDSPVPGIDWRTADGSAIMALDWLQVYAVVVVELSPPPRRRGQARARRPA